MPVFLTLECRGADFAAAQYAGETAASTRKLGTSFTDALLDLLEREPDLLTFVAYNDFPCKGRHHLPKAEREYWQKISRGRLSADLWSENGKVAATAQVAMGEEGVEGRVSAAARAIGESMRYRKAEKELRWRVPRLPLLYL